MTYPFSASVIARVKTCLGAAVLPRVRRTTPGMKMGTIRHRFYQRCLELGVRTGVGELDARAFAMSEVEDEHGPIVRAVLEAINLDGLPLDPAAYVAELAVAWDWETGRARELHRGGERDYSTLGPTEIPGTADTVALVGDDAVYVGDYKAEFMHVPPAKEVHQLRFLSVAIGRLFRRDHAIVEISRPRKDEPAWRDRAELDAFDLAEIAEDTRELALRVIAARAAYAKDRQDLPELHVTEACKRCDSSHACPAQGAALAQLVTTDPDPVARFNAMLTDENAPEVLDFLKGARARLDEYDDIMREHARRSPVRMTDGRIYGPVQVTRNLLKGRELFSTIENMHGRDVAWDVAELKITQTKLTDAMRKVAAESGRKVTHLVREVKERGIADGSWREVPDEEVKVHKAPKERL